MFGKPKHGWVDIDIGEYRGHGSYLTDIPFDFLDAAIHSLENNAPFVLFIDEEGYESYITSYYNATFINRNRYSLETYYILQDHKELIEDGVTDIERYLDDWAYFDCSADEIEEANKRKEELARLIKRVRNCL